MSLRQAIALGLLVVGTWRSAPAQPVPSPPKLPAVLTLDEALRIFHAHGLDLIIADAAVDNAEGDVKVAGAIPNPVFGVGRIRVFTYRTHGYTSDGTYDTSGIDNGATLRDKGWSFDLNDQGALFDTLSGKRGLRLKVARAALAAARQSRVDAERNLVFMVKQQYIQASLASESLGFAVEVQTSATKTLELTQVRHQKGAISEADEARVEVAKLEADQAVATARQALEAAKSGLAALLGVRGELPQFDVQRDLPKFTIPAPLASASREALLREALEQRPDLKGQRDQINRAEASIALARRMRWPDTALVANYQFIGSGGLGTNSPLTPPQLTLGVSLTLPVFYRQQGEIRKAQADFRTQDTQRAKIEAQIANDVSTAFTGFVTSKEMVERMESRLLDRGKRARDLVEFQYLHGAASLLELLDAQRTYIATHVEYLNDLANYWTAVFQLEQAVGKELTR